MCFAFYKNRRYFTAVSAIFCIALAVVLRFFVIPQYFFPIKYEQYVEKYALEYGLEENFVYAVIKIESDFNEFAISRKNAMGLMQITAQTGQWAAQELGISEYSDQMLFDPEVNIKIGCWYLNKLNKQFPDSTKTMLAAYNAGSGNVSKWLLDEAYSRNGVDLNTIPFDETKKYVKKILIANKLYNLLY